MGRRLTPQPPLRHLAGRRMDCGYRLSSDQGAASPPRLPAQVAPRRPPLASGRRVGKTATPGPKAKGSQTEKLCLGRDLGYGHLRMELLGSH